MHRWLPRDAHTTGDRSSLHTKAETHRSPNERRRIDTRERMTGTGRSSLSIISREATRSRPHTSRAIRILASRFDGDADGHRPLGRPIGSPSRDAARSRPFHVVVGVERSSMQPSSWYQRKRRHTSSSNDVIVPECTLKDEETGWGLRIVAVRS